MKIRFYTVIRGIHTTASSTFTIRPTPTHRPLRRARARRRAGRAGRAGQGSTGRRPQPDGSAGQVGRARCGGGGERAPGALLPALWGGGGLGEAGHLEGVDAQLVWHHDGGRLASGRARDGDILSVSL